jgi:hypothetical protein
MFLPASRVSASVGTHTITHHIPTQLRTFAGLPGIQAHFAERHQWDSPAIFDLIDWPLYHAATLSTSFLKRLFVIKWINALLPFQHQQHQFKRSPTAHCPSACGCEDEDWKHFPRCPHQQRQQSWTAFIPIISSVMERWKMDPSLWRILLHLLVLLNTTLQPIPLTDLNDKYLMLLATQRSIGEDSLLFGLLSTEWLRLQDRYLQTLGLPRSQHEASQAVCSLLILVHDQCHGVWLLRNQHPHDADPFNTTSYKHSHLLAQITELYEAAPHMMVHDRDLFAFPMEVRALQFTAITSKALYSHAKPIVETSIKEALNFGPAFWRISNHFRPLIPAALFDIILGR